MCVCARACPRKGCLAPFGKAKGTLPPFGGCGCDQAPLPQAHNFYVVCFLFPSRFLFLFFLPLTPHRSPVLHPRSASRFRRPSATHTSFSSHVPGPHWFRPGRSPDLPLPCCFVFAVRVCLGSRAPDHNRVEPSPGTGRGDQHRPRPVRLPARRRLWPCSRLCK